MNQFMDSLQQSFSNSYGQAQAINTLQEEVGVMKNTLEEIKTLITAGMRPRMESGEE